MKVVLISTYELGRQPFGLASPAAWLERSGAQVTCFDLAVETLEEEAVAVADVVAFYVPMHTATRLAIEAFKRIRALNPGAHYCFYGLYAPMNEQFLRKLGAQSIIGGEFEAPLVALVDRLVQGAEARAKSVVSLDRQKFLVPNRRGLPPLEEYAHLHAGPGDNDRRIAFTNIWRIARARADSSGVVDLFEHDLADYVVDWGPRGEVLSDLQRASRALRSCQ